MVDKNKWRKEIRNLSDVELDDELQRPTGNWNEDILRESLRRLLKSSKPKKSDNSRKNQSAGITLKKTLTKIKEGMEQDVEDLNKVAD